MVMRTLVCMVPHGPPEGPRPGLGQDRHSMHMSRWEQELCSDLHMDCSVVMGLPMPPVID